MTTITFNDKQQAFDIIGHTFKAHFIWQDNLTEHAILQFRTDREFGVTLYIQRTLRGSIFSIDIGEQYLNLALDCVYLRNGKVSLMEFAVECSEEVEIEVV